MGVAYTWVIAHCAAQVRIRDVLWRQIAAATERTGTRASCRPVLRIRDALWRRGRRRYGESGAWVFCGFALRIRDVLWRQVAAATERAECGFLAGLYFVYAMPYGGVDAAATMRAGCCCFWTIYPFYANPRGGSEGPRPLRPQSAGPALPVRGRFLRSRACPAGAKIDSSQFEVDLPLANRSRLWRDALVQIKDLKQRALRPEKSADFSAKTANLPLNDRQPAVCTKYALPAM